jgi:hypothetical protein
MVIEHLFMFFVSVGECGFFDLFLAADWAVGWVV